MRHFPSTMTCDRFCSCIEAATELKMYIYIYKAFMKTPTSSHIQPVYPIETLLKESILPLHPVVHIKALWFNSAVCRFIILSNKSRLAVLARTHSFIDERAHWWWYYSCIWNTRSLWTSYITLYSIERKYSRILSVSDSRRECVNSFQLLNLLWVISVAIVNIKYRLCTCVQSISCTCKAYRVCCKSVWWKTTISCKMLTWVHVHANKYIYKNIYLYLLVCARPRFCVQMCACTCNLFSRGKKPFIHILRIFHAL